MHWYSGLKSIRTSSLLSTSTEGERNIVGQPRLWPDVRREPDSHSYFSFNTLSTAPPTLPSLAVPPNSAPSFSLRILHRLIRRAISSVASLPICPEELRTSNNHDFSDAVTASFI